MMRVRWLVVRGVVDTPRMSERYRSKGSNVFAGNRNGGQGHLLVLTKIVSGLIQSR